MLGRGDGDLSRALQLRDGVAPSTAVLGAALIAFCSFVGFETSANLAVPVLRRDRVDHDHLRAPTALPVLALASCVVLATQQRDPLTRAIAGGAPA